jgi:HAD superfamily hydrolase (TIGR01490 family)
MAKPFAVFDIDGTVIRWQLHHAMIDVLAKKGIMNKKAFARVKEARMSWKRRSGDASYHQYELALIEMFEQELVGLSVDDLSEAASTVFNEYKDQVYTYTRDLIRSLKAKHYLLFAISGSPDVVIEKLINYYGFDDFAASTFAARDGLYTGESQVSIGKKAQLLQDLIAKHGATTDHSIGVGDSEGDIDMLKMVDEPIAFNPTNQLLMQATQHHWSVVVERKNVIYSLHYRNGEYQLSL